MKKILLLSVLIVSLNSFGQYVVNQSLGSDSTLVTSKGGLKSRIINKVFTDTTQANTQRIKFYDGSQIITITGGNKFWIRDSTLNKWIEIVSTKDRFGFPTEDVRSTAARYFSSAGQDFTLDSLGNTRFVIRANNKNFHVSGTNVSNGDSAYVRVEKTSLGVPRVLFGTNSATGTIINRMVFSTGGTSPNAVWGLTSNTTFSHNFALDTFKAQMFSGTGDLVTRGSYIQAFPDSIYLWRANQSSALKITNGAADQYATDSLKWRLSNDSASLIFNADGWHAYQTLGEYYFYNVARETDTTGLDLLVWDRADEEMKRIPSDLIGGGGGSQGLQDVITVDPVLTTTNNIDVAGNDLSINNAALMNFSVTDQLGLRQGSTGSALYITDSIFLEPKTGKLNIDSLRSGYIDTALFKPLARKATGDIVQMNSWAQVGGGGSGVTTMAAIGATPNANGATISGSTLNLQPASASFGGVVTTGAQTWAGIKTHNAQDIFAGGLTIRGQYTANEGMMLQHDLTGGTGSNGLGEIVVYDGDFRSFKIRALDYNFAPSGTTAMFINSSGRVGIGGIGSGATAALHLPASTTAASTGQIKLAEGSDLTTPEDGNINYVANNLKFTEGSTVYTLAKTLTATATLNFDLTAVNSQDLTITVTGAASGDAVSLGLDPASVAADITFFGWVSAANTVTIRCSRVGGGGAADPASGTFRASVVKY